MYYKHLYNTTVYFFSFLVYSFLVRLSFEARFAYEVCLKINRSTFCFVFSCFMSIKTTHQKSKHWANSSFHKIYIFAPLCNYIKEKRLRNTEKSALQDGQTVSRHVTGFFH